MGRLLLCDLVDRSVEHPSGDLGMAQDQHHHAHAHEGSELSPIELRVRALESILTEKGYVDPAAIDALVEKTYETKVGPRNGAKVVAKAWTDLAFRAWLLTDAT